jgi:hypothetical protein
MRKITFALLATLALGTAAQAEGGDNPARDFYNGSRAPLTRSFVDPSFTASIAVDREAPARSRAAPVEDFREYQLRNGGR